MSGRVEAIWLRPASRVAVRAVTSVEAVAGRGLDGDHAGGGRRQITLLDAAEWRRACRDLGREVDPAVRRANLLVDGLDLGASIGAHLAVGGVEVEVLGPLKPCRRLDEAAPGLCRVLTAGARSGVFGRILRGGPIGTGDPVRTLQASPAGSQNTT